MSFFGVRRARQTRVFRPTPSFREKLSSGLQDYRILTLLLVALFAIILLQIAVQSWRSRFPYREGQVAVSGIQARVDFEIENVLATRQARADAEANAPPIFIQDNTVLDELRASFRNDINAIANSESLKDIPPPVVSAFQLATEIPGDVEKGTAPTTRFAQVRRSMTESSMTVGERVNLIVEEFHLLLAGAEQIGVLDTAERARISLSETDLAPQKSVELVDTAGDPLNETAMAEISLENQLLETGRFGAAWVALTNLQQVRPAVESWLRNRLTGQLTYDRSATEQRRRDAFDAVEPQYDRFAAGQILIPAGTLIEANQLTVLNAEYSAHEQQVSFGQRLLRIGGASLMVTLMVVLFGVYIYRSERHLLEETGQLVTFILICAGAIFLSCALSQDPLRAEVLPLLAAVMIITIVHNQMLAVFSAFCMSLLVTMSTVADLGHFTVLMALCFTVVIPLRRVSSRSTLIKVGFLLALVAFIGVWGVGLISSPNYADGLQNQSVMGLGLRFAAWSLVCCFVVGGSLPFIESAFGIVTDISLLELTDVSHPLLQELARRAPGTYNHSISVATIGEAAADAIGANGLLLRVGAYFHDIGKMLKPEYFIENMTSGQENPHDKLAPAMSALIIIGHVKDGVELAEQHNLPRKLIDFIEQHHGTTLVEYFFREAASRADEDHRTDADESTFRYPGSRPLTKETGVMMLADAVESASRTLSEPTPKRIQSLVNDIALKRVLDGQFDECGLTMSEINVVKESLVKSLLAVHHGRIKYPDQKSAG